MTVYQPSISTEYARVRVTGDVTLSTQTVELAFMSSRGTEPSSGDWRSATWLGTADTTRDAGVLVGPAGLVLAAATWYVWFRVTDTPEIPARYAGTLVIT
jgi:hypothetical protein